MKIVITGGAGFIGSQVADFYAKKDHKVVVFDNLSGFDQKPKNSKIFFGWKLIEK